MNLSASCAKLVRAARSNFYWAFVFLPKPKREAIFAAYAFARHTDDLVDEAPSPEAARRGLALWREELAACYRGSPGHPITRCLWCSVERFGIPEAYFRELLAGVEMDLDQRRYETFAELERYCYRVAGVVGLICIEIFGYRNPATKDYALHLGTALQLTNILRDLGEDAGRDRIYVPREDLRRFGCAEADLKEGRVGRPFRDLMAFECARAQQYYDRAAAVLPEEDRRAMFSAEIMSRIYRRILLEIERRDYDVFRERVRVSTPRKLGIAFGLWLSSGILVPRTETA